jgi:hypothetical protein
VAPPHDHLDHHPMITTPTITKRKTLGRPLKFNAQTRRRLIRCVAIGMPITHVPAACGLSYSGFCDYRNAHPKFETAIQRAIAKAIEKHLKLILTAAEKGDAACSRWFLERCHSQHFGRQKIELTGADGAPLAGAIAVYLPEKQTAIVESVTEAIPALAEGGEVEAA